MEDRTIIRLAQLGCGAFGLSIHAVYGVDSLLILMIAVLWGIPLDLLLERRKNNHE